MNGPSFTGYNITKIKKLAEFSDIDLDINGNSKSLISLKRQLESLLLEVTKFKDSYISEYTKIAHKMGKFKTDKVPVKAAKRKELLIKPSSFYDEDSISSLTSAKLSTSQEIKKGQASKNKRTNSKSKTGKNKKAKIIKKMDVPNVTEHFDVPTEFWNYVNGYFEPIKDVQIINLQNFVCVDEYSLFNTALIQNLTHKQDPVWHGRQVSKPILYNYLDNDNIKAKQSLMDLDNNDFPPNSLYGLMLQGFMDNLKKHAILDETKFSYEKIIKPDFSGLKKVLTASTTALLQNSARDDQILDPFTIFEISLDHQDTNPANSSNAYHLNSPSQSSFSRTISLKNYEGSQKRQSHQNIDKSIDSSTNSINHNPPNLLTPMKSHKSHNAVPRMNSLPIYSYFERGAPNPRVSNTNPKTTIYSNNNNKINHKPIINNLSISNKPKRGSSFLPSPKINPSSEISEEIARLYERLNSILLRNDENNPQTSNYSADSPYNKKQSFTSPSLLSIQNLKSPQSVLTRGCSPLNTDASSDNYLADIRTLMFVPAPEIVKSCLCIDDQQAAKGSNSNNKNNKMVRKQGTPFFTLNNITKNTHTVQTPSNKVQKLEKFCTHPSKNSLGFSGYFGKNCDTNSVTPQKLNNDAGVMIQEKQIAIVIRHALQFVIWDRKEQHCLKELVEIDNQLKDLFKKYRRIRIKFRDVPDEDVDPILDFIARRKAICDSISHDAKILFNE